MSTTINSAPTLRIFLTNLSRYAEGDLVGTWLALPADPDVLAAAYAKIGTPEDEYFITDYESDFDGLTVGEYDNVNDLNEKAMTLAELDDYEIECINAMLSEGYDFEYAVEHIDDCVVWYGCSDMTDVAEQYCDECDILSSIPENLQPYFDYEAFGRDMSFEGQYVFTDNGNCVEILR